MPGNELTDKEFVTKMIELAPELTVLNAKKIYALIADEKMLVDRTAYCRGYNNGHQDAKNTRHISRDKKLLDQAMDKIDTYIVKINEG
jgi:hypothetical protein